MYFIFYIVFYCILYFIFYFIITVYLLRITSLYKTMSCFLSLSWTFFRPSLHDTITEYIYLQRRVKKFTLRGYYYIIQSSTTRRHVPSILQQKPCPIASPSSPPPSLPLERCLEIVINTEAGRVNRLAEIPRHPADGEGV